MTFPSLPLYVVALGGKAYEVGLVASTTNPAALVVRPLTGRLSAASAAPLLIGAVRAKELRRPAGQQPDGSDAGQPAAETCRERGVPLQGHVSFI